MRPRANVNATVPNTGRVNASANVIVTWDPGTPLADIEAAIKEAARKAVQRARVVHRISVSPDPVAGQLTLPLGT